MKTSIVYIGLGSNIQQPEQQIKLAIAALDDLPMSEVIRDSGYFKSHPMGPEDQPDYVNAVVELSTSLAAVELLQHCQHIPAVWWYLQSVCAYLSATRPGSTICRCR